MRDNISKWLCKILGHNMMLINWDVSGGSKCIRCGHTKPAIKWSCPENKE